MTKKQIQHNINLLSKIYDEVDDYTKPKVDKVICNLMQYVD